MKTTNPMRLRNLMERVEYAISKDPERAALRGVHLEAGVNEELIATATDGHRLAQSREPGFPIPLPTSGFTIGFEDLKALKKLLPRKAGTISALLEVELTPPAGTGFNELTLKVRGKELVIRDASYEAGAFPAWRNVIPKQRGPAAHPKGNLALALRDLADAHEKDVVKVKVSTKHAIQLTTEQAIAGGSIIGQAGFEMEYDGDDFEVPVNGHYLADALEHVRDPALVAPEDLGPVVIVGNDDDLALVMPVRE